METVIREATAGDCEVLCELFDEVDALHRDHLAISFYRKLGYEAVSQRISQSLD